MGFRKDVSSRILVTGGASRNVVLLQMLADVFEMPVYTIEVDGSAALGGAMRARYCMFLKYSPRDSNLVVHSKSPLKYSEYYPCDDVSLACNPIVANARIYRDQFAVFKTHFDDFVKE